MGDWRPNPGPQERFLSLSCYEALYGGAAGGGKSDAILVDAIRHVGKGYGVGYQALLLRRTFPELEKGLILRSRSLYGNIEGAEYSTQSKTWTFPGGERVVFGYLDSEQDVFRYQGLAFQFIGFDELTQFSESQYTYLLSRLRYAGADRFSLRVRATTNPGGDGHEWVFKRFGYWLDPARKCADPGQVLHIVRDVDGAEHIVAKGAKPDHDGGVPMMTGTDGSRFEVSREMSPLGRTFVPAKLSDNPTLASDATYRRALDELDPVLRAQLADGNWLAQPAKGLYAKREWFSFVGRCPEGVKRWVRAWDLGATLKGDFTVGVKMGELPNGQVVVADVVRFRGTPGDVEAVILATAESDGPTCTVWLPQDPGQAGVAQVASFSRLLKGKTFRFVRPNGDKVTRFGPFSSQVQARNVVLVQSEWTDAYVRELEAFPEGSNDDQVDATSDAYAGLSSGAPTSDERSKPRLLSVSLDTSPIGM